VKVEHDADFRPITITLETKEEAQVLKDVIGRTNGSEANDMIYTLWKILNEAGIQDKTYFTGSLRAISTLS
jgi:hypothetical protein